MATVSQKGGIYIEINGDVKPLEEQLQKAKKVSRTVADDIAKTTKNAFSTKAMNGIADSITRSFGSIQSSIRSLNTDTKAFASQFSALGKEIGLTTAQANILGNSISNALKVKEEGRIVQHLRNIQRQTGMTVDEMKKLSQELGVSDKQFEMFSSRASKSMSSMSKLGSAAKTAGIAIAGATATLGVFAKATLEASMALERLQAAYSTIYGDKNAAASQLEFIRQQTKAVGQQYMETAEAAKAFFASGQNSTLAPEMNKIFTAISNAGAALQLTQDDINGVFRAFGQMISKGKVQAEELRGQVGERLPGAFKMAAEAMGMSTAELDKFMADGKLVAEDLLPKLEKVMNEKFAGAAKKAADTLQGSLNNMYSEWEQFKANIAASGPANFFVRIITEALANKNAEYSKQERENQAKEYLRKTGAPALNLPGGANGGMIEFSENQIAQASAQLQMMNAINTISKQASDTLQKNMEEAVSQYRQSTTSILKNSKETKLKELSDQQEALKNRKKANDEAIEYEFRTRQISADKRKELLEDSQKRYDAANKEIEKNIKKTKEAAENAGKSGAGAANRAANAQANYNTTLENTRSHIESLEEQLKLDKTESITAKKIAISEKYEEQIRRVNNEIDKQVRSGSISAVQGDELKKLRQKELTLEKTLKLRELENQEIEKNLSHLQEQLSFYNELAEMTGNFTTSMELQNQIIDIQAQKYRDLKTIPEELIQEWANWKKLEASTDPFDGAYRGLLKFQAEFGDSAKQWESLTYNFAKNFESTSHQMFDDFLETGKLSFDSMGKLFKQLLKDMAYYAFVQPIVLSVIGGGVGAATSASGNAAQQGLQSVGGSLVGAASGLAQNSLMGMAGSYIKDAASGAINSVAASMFPSTFAANQTMASYNALANSVVQQAGGVSNLPTQTATSALSGFGTMGAGLLGGAIGSYLLVPALGIKEGLGTSIGSTIGGGLGGLGGGIAGAALIGGSFGGPIGAGLGALAGTVLGALGGSLFGGGYEDEPGYYINTYTDLTKKEGLAGYKQGTAIQNHRWDSFSDSTASAMRDKVARPLMTQLRENTVALHEQIVALGGKDLGESFFAAVRKHQGSGDKRTGKGGIELSDYFHVHGEWHETNSPDVEKWAEQIGEQYQKVIVKSIANMDMRPITIAADGMVADTEEEIAIALAKAGSLISVGDAIEDEKLKKSFEEGISKSLISALKKLDTSKLGLNIDKSSLAGWQTAIQAMAAWQEATNAIELMKDPISEITSQLGALDTQFLQWKATLEQLGWQEQKVKEIEEERIDALYRTSSEYLDKYIEKDSTVSGIEERFNDIEDILKALTDSGAKEGDSDQYQEIELKGRGILRDFVLSSLDSYINAESASGVAVEGSSAFQKVIASLEEQNKDDEYDVVTEDLIESIKDLEQEFKNRAKLEAEENLAQIIHSVDASLAEYSGTVSESAKSVKDVWDNITSGIEQLQAAGASSNKVNEYKKDRYDITLKTAKSFFDTQMGYEDYAKSIRDTNDDLKGVINQMEKLGYSSKVLEGLGARLETVNKRNAEAYFKEYEKGSEFEQQLSTIDNTLSSVINTMSSLGYSTEYLNELDSRRISILRQQAQEMLSSTYQNLSLRYASLKYGQDSSQYGLLDLMYNQYNERQTLASQFGANSEIYESATQIQTAEYLQKKLDYLNKELQDTINSEIQQQKEAYNAQIKQQDALLENVRSQLDVAKDNLSAAERMRDTFKSIYESLAKARRELWSGDDNLLGTRYQEAYADFNSMFTKVKTGDEDALNELPSLATDLLSIGRDQLGSRNEYTDLFYEVDQKLKTAEEYASKQVSQGERDVAYYESMISNLNSNIAAIEAQKAQLTAQMEADTEALQKKLDENSRKNTRSIAEIQKEIQVTELALQTSLAQVNSSISLGTVQIVQAQYSMTTSLERLVASQSALASALQSALWEVRQAIENQTAQYASTQSAYNNVAALAAIQSASTATSSKYLDSKYATADALITAKVNSLNSKKEVLKHNGKQYGPKWTKDLFVEFMTLQGLTLETWYKKYGKAEGFASGGVTPQNKAYWVGENGPELLMSPHSYGILNNRDSIDLMRPRYTNLSSDDSYDMGREEAVETNNILRQILTKIDSQAYDIQKMKRRMDMWNEEGLLTVAATA